MSAASEESDEDTIVIPINRSYSDGSQSTWPKDSRYGMPDDSTWREKIARLWLQKIGAYEEGVNYTIDRLPEGYALFDRPRGTNPDVRDRLIWGHPSGQYFPSIVQFFPHFYSLMTGQISNCSCCLCPRLKKKRETGGRLPHRPVRKTKNRPIYDSKGTPDVYRMAIMKLKDHGMLDESITEPASMDWRAERKPLEEYLTKLRLQASFVPRAGEIVLWVPSIEGDLAWNNMTRRVEMYSHARRRWLGTPTWRAGIVSQTPEEEVALQDLVVTSEKKSQGINNSGFRVETFSDPNSHDKSYSLHYKYVPLACIKPFNAWELFLQGTPREKFHPSIEYAMTVMSSFSLLEKYRFKGTWPDASVYAQGIFVGAELLIIGDAVRLKPLRYKARHDQRGSVTDIMVIENIRLDLIGCIDDPGSEQLAKQVRARIQGRVYTTDRSRAQTCIAHKYRPQPMSHDEVIDAFQYIGMGGYGKWYSMLPADTQAEVSLDMVLGRCYEPDATALLYGTNNLGLDMHGIVSGRNYSQQADERIPEGKLWFWGDFRTETLAVDSLNGLDVGHDSEARDLMMWGANLKVLDGRASAGDSREAKARHGVGRTPTKPASSFAELNRTSTLVRSGLEVAGASNPVSSAEEGDGNGNVDEVEESSDSEEDFSIPLPYVRGGTEETEFGDYSPGDEYRTPHRKRPKHKKTN